MKLSEMSTEKATECMAAIVPAMRSIMENEGVVKLIAEHRTPADKKRNDRPVFRSDEEQKAGGCMHSFSAHRENLRRCSASAIF